MDVAKGPPYLANMEKVILRLSEHDDVIIEKQTI